MLCTQRPGLWVRAEGRVPDDKAQPEFGAEATNNINVIHPCLVKELGELFSWGRVVGGRSGVFFLISLRLEERG